MSLLDEPSEFDGQTLPPQERKPLRMTVFDWLAWILLGFALGMGATWSFI